ncbi:hypothetical protein WJX73_010307 [Symbiochloris irregularis]|uniref:Uncharacterized protein n=1 Tax=Symbiochloris irregularis TaxID=706552 RepID=A0AAW1NSK2_9CHLO
MNDILESLKTASPFLPAQFVAETALKILEVFLAGDDPILDLAADLCQFTNDLLESESSELDNLKKLQKRLDVVDKALEA